MEICVVIKLNKDDITTKGRVYVYVKIFLYIFCKGKILTTKKWK